MSGDYTKNTIGCSGSCVNQVIKCIQLYSFIMKLDLYMKISDICYLIVKDKYNVICQFCPGGGGGGRSLIYSKIHVIIICIL